VVAKTVAQLHGIIDVTSSPGEGTKFLITLPLTLLIVKALIVSVEGRAYAIPINAVGESLMISSHEIRTVEGHEVIGLRGQTLPLLRLQDIFMLTPQSGRDIAGLSKEPTTETMDDLTDRVYVVVAGVAEKRVGIVVDEVLEQREIVIKSLGEGLGNVSGIAGVTEVGTRKIILVLDVRELIDEATSGKGSSYVQCTYH
jgi:two-component system chemotaxis sensor kinase CheA